MCPVSQFSSMWPFLLVGFLSTWPNFLHGYCLPTRRKQNLPEEGLHLRAPQCPLNSILLFKGSLQASPDEIVLLMEGAVCAEEDLVVAIFKDYVLVFSALRGCACKLLEGLKQ